MLIYSTIGDPLSLNLYTYCHNEPMMYFDPTGHWEEIELHKDMNANQLLNAILQAKDMWEENQKIIDEAKKTGFFGGIYNFINKKKINDIIAEAKANQQDATVIASEARDMIKQTEAYKTNKHFKDNYEEYYASKYGGTRRQVNDLLDVLARAVVINPDNFKEPSKGTGNGEWIPGTVMQLNGTSAEEKALKKWFDNKGIKWEQSKIDAIWQATEEINKQYGIQIDPRFLLAIIIQEGTGSFNTSSSNRAADGQNGIETNYALDLMKANSLIFGKILGYIYYGSEFRQAVSSNNNLSGISGGGDIFQYANWSTPIIRMNTKKVETGVYAGHGAWGSSVRNIYNDLTGGSASNYEQYISGIDKSVAQNIAQSQGIKLPTYKFVASQNSQNSKGKPDGNWTIIGQLK